MRQSGWQHYLIKQWEEGEKEGREGRGKREGRDKEGEEESQGFWKINWILKIGKNYEEILMENYNEAEIKLLINKEKWPSFHLMNL